MEKHKNNKTKSSEALEVDNQKGISNGRNGERELK